MLKMQKTKGKKKKKQKKKKVIAVVLSGVSGTPALPTTSSRTGNGSTCKHGDITHSKHCCHVNWK